MSHEKLQWMKDSLICVVENQLCNLNEVDTEELGEAIDMIKDLEEAIYYCTVTEAMNNPKKEHSWEMKKGDHHQENSDSRMYYGYPMMYSDNERNRRDDGTFYMDSKGSNGMPNSGNGTSNTNYYDDSMARDSREGRSPMSRRMYMEAKHTGRDKATQLRELEKYMQELSQDITEMIADASPEEKQYLEKKITALASKIGQMK
jgi:hypothetical protein